MSRSFSPEFLNRLDETIVFKPLEMADMETIVGIMLKEFVVRLSSFDMHVEFTTAATKYLMDKGFDPAHGARPLRRAIQRYVEDPLSELLLQKGLRKDAEIHVDDKGGELTFDVVARTK